MPATARLFRLLGLHAGPDISAAAAASLAGLPPDEARRGLGELTRAHLLAEHAPGRFSCHDLLRAYAAELTQSADSEAERRAATGRMLDHYLRTANSRRAAAAPHPQADNAGPARAGRRARARQRRRSRPRPGSTPSSGCSWPPPDGPWRQASMPRPGRSRGRCSGSWTLRGRWHDWVMIEQCALAATQRLGDPVGPGLWPTSDSATPAAGSASYEDAYAHLDRALSIHTELGDHAGQAYVHNSLAIMLDSQGRTSEALEQAKQALESYTAAGHANGRAVALNSVGWFHAMLGNHQEALSYCRAVSRPVPRDRQRGRDGRRAGHPRIRPPASRPPRRSHFRATSRLSTCTWRSAATGARPRLSATSATPATPPGIWRGPGPTGNSHSRSWMTSTIRTLTGSAPSSAGSSSRYATATCAAACDHAGAGDARATCFGRPGI